jgi:hypothetical protein
LDEQHSFVDRRGTYFDGVAKPHENCARYFVSGRSFVLVFILIFIDLLLHSIFDFLHPWDRGSDESGIVLEDEIAVFQGLSPCGFGSFECFCDPFMQFFELGFRLARRDLSRLECYIGVVESWEP